MSISFALSGSDPAIKLDTAPVAELAAAWWQADPRLRQQLTAAWARTRPLSDTQRRLRSGPMAVAFDACDKLGWYPHCTCPWKWVHPTGPIIDLCAMAPFEVNIIAARDAQAVVWRQWTGGSSGGGTSTGSTAWTDPKPTRPLLEPIIKLLAKKDINNWGWKQKACLRNYTSGGLWPAQRLFQAGLVDCPDCPCGLPQTNSHVCFSCDRTLGFRNQFGDPDMLHQLGLHPNTWAAERLLVQTPDVEADLPLRESFRYTGVLCDPNFLVSGLAAPDGSLFGCQWQK